MFPILATNKEAVIQVELTVEEKKSLTDIYVGIGQHSKSIALELFLNEAFKQNIRKPENNDAVKRSFVKKGEIANKVIKLMSSEEAPKTLANLKARTFAEFPDCTQEALEYNVSKIVAWANGIGNGTFEQFLEYFKD
jgi:hypothetical protein